MTGPESYQSVPDVMIREMLDDKLTAYRLAKLDLVEALTTYGTTIGSLHPRFQAFIMQIVSTRKEMCYQFDLESIGFWWCRREADRQLGFMICIF